MSTKTDEVLNVPESIVNNWFKNDAEGYVL